MGDLRHEPLMPARFAALVDVLCDSIVDVDALANVEQHALGIEEAINAAASRQ